MVTYKERLGQENSVTLLITSNLAYSYAEIGEIE
jgi:hypothetical protein